MNREELIKEIEKQEELLHYLKYKNQIMDLSSDIDLLMPFIQMKDERIKEQKEKLDKIQNILDED
jgi:hypothetical protein